MRYLPITYSISFQESPLWDNRPGDNRPGGNRPAYVFRSVLGLALKRLTCALKLQNKCSECMAKESCVYSVFFETNTSKDVASLPGRDRATHPFVIDIEKLTDEEAVLVITFIGRAINYIPYLNLALQNAGELGIGRNRAKFTVDSVTTNGTEFVPNLREIEKQCLTWPSEECQNIEPVAINLITPCRIKEKGQYVSELSLNSLLANMSRRVSTLVELFGEKEDKTLDFSFSPIASEPIAQKWVDTTYYSSRQKTKMQLGGVVGKILIKEEVPAEDKALIEAMKLFHVGKNISFGLGKVEIEYNTNTKG